MKKSKDILIEEKLHILSLDQLRIKKNAEIAVSQMFVTTSLPKLISAIKGMWVMDMSSRGMFVMDMSSRVSRFLMKILFLIPVTLR
jgi:hypothetical protein